MLYTLLPCEIKVKGFDNNVNWKMKFGKNENKDLNIKIAKHELVMNLKWNVAPRKNLLI